MNNLNQWESRAQRAGIDLLQQNLLILDCRYTFYPIHATHLLLLPTNQREGNFRTCNTFALDADNLNVIGSNQTRIDTLKGDAATIREEKTASPLLAPEARSPCISRRSTSVSLSNSDALLLPVESAAAMRSLST